MKIARILTSVLCAVTLVFGLVAGAHAADYPSKSIKLIVPFDPGGSIDVAARVMVPYLAKELGVEIPVVNIAGAAGFAGTLQAYEARPDGYTLLCHLPTLMTSYHTGVARFTWDSLVPIARFSQFTEALAVPADAPYKTTQELIDYAKANPGKVKWGLNIGAGLHFMALDFAVATDTVGLWQYVASGGDETSLKALLGGHIDVMGGSDIVLAQHAEAGTLRLLGAFTNERIANLPDLPTFKEQGFDSSFIFDVTMYAPPKTDPAIVKKIGDALDRVAANPDYRREAAGQSLIVAPLRGKALWEELLDQDVRFYKFARVGGLIPDRK